MDALVVPILLVVGAAYVWLAVVAIRRARRRLAPGRRRFVLVSAIIAFFFAPTIIGGHGLAIVPVALAPIFLLGGWPRFAPVLAAELGLVIVVFLVVPFVGFWVLTMLVGLAAMGLRRLRARP